MRTRPALAPPRTVPVGQARRTLEAVRVFRTNFVFGSLLLLLGVLLCRFAQLQIVQGRSMRAEADRRQQARVVLPGMRGRILDRHGRLLATSAFGREVAVDPDPQVLAEKDLPAFAERLAALLDDERLPASVLEQRIAHARMARRVVKGPLGLKWMRTGTRHLVLAPYVSEPRVVAALDEAGEQRGFRALKVRCVERRAYPNGDYAMQVIGLPAPEGSDDTQGEGIEGLIDRQRGATQLTMTLCRDGKSRCFAETAMFDRDLLAGRDVHLSLDVVLQHHAERELDRLLETWKPSQATAIVLDPRTGAVLALAARATDEKTGKRTAVYNLATRALYEPGSVFKPFTVAWALRHGLPAETVVPMPLATTFPRDRNPIRDTHYVGDGVVQLLLAQSSNTGAAWLVDWMGVEALQGLFGWVGLDEPTGIELPHELCFGNAHKVLGRADTLRAGFGHAFTITPLRLASAFTAFARQDGRASRPTLMARATSPVTPGLPLCLPEHLAIVREGLEGCVTGGTAATAFRGCSWSAAGKTGTALVDRNLKHVCSFAGYAPANDPQLVVLVMAVTRRSQDGSGGRVAAPVVRRILERSLPYLGVAPDLAESGT